MSKAEEYLEDLGEISNGVRIPFAKRKTFTLNLGQMRNLIHKVKVETQQEVLADLRSKKAEDWLFRCQHSAQADGTWLYLGPPTMKQILDALEIAKAEGRDQERNRVRMETDLLVKCVEHMTDWELDLILRSMEETPGLTAEKARQVIDKAIKEYRDANGTGKES